jgi:hypothetical protein
LTKTGDGDGFGGGGAAPAVSAVTVAVATPTTAIFLQRLAVLRCLPDISDLPFRPPSQVLLRGHRNTRDASWS